jgi:glycosyltransferase involved in cell wall biosynthesis
MINVLMVLPGHAPDHPLLKEQARLAPDRFRVTVCSLTGSPVRQEGPTEKGNLPVEHFLGTGPDRGRRRPLIPLVRRLAKIIDDGDIEIVNSHLHRVTLPTILAARLSRARPIVVETIHGLGSARTPGRKLLNLFLYRNVERVIAVCDAVRRDLLEENLALSDRKVISIPNGIAYDRFPASVDKSDARGAIPLDDREGFWFGAVGRLSRGKNTRTLITAFADVVKARPECSLVVAGAGPELPRLRDQATALGLKGRVAFLGFREDIPFVLRACDAYVHTSLREGIPLALLEAMASGLPVVASDRGGIVEVVSGVGDNSTGVDNTGVGHAGVGSLVNPEDTAGLAKAMIDLAGRDTAVRERMGARARKRVLEGFPATRMVASLERLYEELSGSRRKG